MAFPELPDDRRARPRRYRGSDAPAAEQGERPDRVRDDGVDERYRPGRRHAGGVRRPDVDDAGVAREQDFLLGAALQHGVPARRDATPPAPDGEPAGERPRSSHSLRAGAPGRHGAPAAPEPDRGGAAHDDRRNGRAPREGGPNGHPRNGSGPDLNGSNGHHAPRSDPRAGDQASRRPSERIRDSYAFDGTGPDTGPRRRPPREERPPPRPRRSELDAPGYENGPARENEPGYGNGTGHRAEDAPRPRRAGPGEPPPGVRPPRNDDGAPAPGGSGSHRARSYGERPYGDEPVSRRRGPDPAPQRPFDGPPPRRRVGDPALPGPRPEEPSGRRRAPEPGAYPGEPPARRRAQDPAVRPAPPGDAPDPHRTRRDVDDPRRRPPGRHGSAPTGAVAVPGTTPGLDDPADPGTGTAAASETTALPAELPTGRRRAERTRGPARGGAAGPAATGPDDTARARDPVPGVDGEPGAAALAGAPGDDDPESATDTAGPREGKRSGPAGVAGRIAALRSGARKSGDDDGEKKPMSFWKELPLLIGVALVLTFLISTFVAKVFVIPSGSMETTLHGCTGCTNDRVLVDKVTYNFTDVSPGDVVVFRGPDSWSGSEYQPDESASALTKGLQMAGSLVGLAPPDEKDFVKRVIAVGGQTVACCDALNQVMVDGQPLEEPYIYYLPEAGPARQIPFGPITVPEGEMWMMGDSRNNSADSRASGHGPVPEENVIGKVRLIVLPFDRFGWVDAVNPQTTTRTAMGAEGAAGSGGLPAGAPLALGMMGTFPLALSRRRSLRRRAEDERFLPLTRHRSRWRRTS